MAAKFCDIPALYIYIGYLAHKEIGAQYSSDLQNIGHEIYNNKGFATSVPTLTGSNRRLRPDILNKTTKEVYEIKSALVKTLGAAIESALPQLQHYLDIVNEEIANLAGGEDTELYTEVDPGIQTRG